MIINGSRYIQSIVTYENQATQVAVPDKSYTPQRITTITTKSGDTFQQVASHVLGDSTQYWKIAKLNPFIRFPDAIPTGTILRVPLA